MNVVVICPEYLKDIVSFGAPLSITIQGFGSYQPCLEMFHVLSASEVAYVVIENELNLKGLEKLLDKCALQHSSIHTPRVIIATKDDTQAITLLKSPKYKNINIGMLTYKFLSPEEVQRIFGTIYLENYDIFKGKLIAVEELERVQIPSLTARFNLSGAIRSVFAPIEPSPNLELNLDIDTDLKTLMKANIVLGLLRRLIIFKFFGKEYDSDELLVNEINKMERSLRGEYQILYDYIREVFDAGIYRNFKIRV